MQVTRVKRSPEMLSVPSCSRALLCTAAMLMGACAQADEVQVAVAANFAGPFQQIAAGFQAATGHQAIVAIGSTGKFHTQIPKGEVLKKGDFQHLAVANPRLAPYGAAAMEALGKLGLSDNLAPRIVQGENIAQAQQFVATGNAELGFVALSQVAVPGKPQLGSFWLVPTDLYTPIRQNAVLLKTGANQAAAQALLKHLQSDAAKAVIQAWGYGL